MYYLRRADGSCTGRLVTDVGIIGSSATGLIGSLGVATDALIANGAVYEPTGPAVPGWVDGDPNYACVAMLVNGQPVPGGSNFFQYGSRQFIPIAPTGATVGSAPYAVR